VPRAALAEQLKWYKILADGRTAMEQLYRQIGYPTQEEEAAAAAWNDEVERQLAEALAADEQDRRSQRPARDSAGAA
jgi:hypothetical protein